MAIYTIEDNNIILRDVNLTSPPLTIGFPNAWALDADDNLNVYAVHSSKKVSVVNVRDNISRPYYVETAGFNAVLPILVSTDCCKIAGTFLNNNAKTFQRYLVLPANNGGLLFLNITYKINDDATVGTLLDASYKIDNSFRTAGAVGTIYQIERGYKRNVSSTNGTGFWYDLVLVLQNGPNFDFAYLSQFQNSTVLPYLLNPMGEIQNNWLFNTTWTYASPSPNGYINAADDPGIAWDEASKAYYFAQGNQSAFAGDELKTTPNLTYPTVGPVLSGTRNFVEFSHRADPDAFGINGVALDNWENYTINQVKSNSNGVVYTDAINRYINSVNVA